MSAQAYHHTTDVIAPQDQFAYWRDAICDAYVPLEPERDAARNSLAERTVIERAKGVLMQRRRLSEPEAYKLMRRWAMDRGLKIAAIAEQILSEN